MILGLKEIRCVDIFDLCSSRYRLAISSAVRDEILPPFDKLPSCVKVLAPSDFRFKPMLNHVIARYPNIGIGELSTYLVTLLELVSKGRKAFIVTDDKRFRKTLPTFRKDQELERLYGGPIPNVPYIWTLSLVKQVVKKEGIDSEILSKIAGDVRTSTFRYSEDWLRKFEDTPD
jgi:rRNA-processing protein FCF1